MAQSISWAIWASLAGQLIGLVGVILMIVGFKLGYRSQWFFAALITSSLLYLPSPILPLALGFLIYLIIIKGQFLSRQEGNDAP